MVIGFRRPPLSGKHRLDCCDVDAHFRLLYRYDRVQRLYKGPLRRDFMGLDGRGVGGGCMVHESKPRRTYEGTRSEHHSR